MTKADASEAIISLLKTIDPKPNEWIDLYSIGIPLVIEADDKFTETEVLNGLLYLESLKLIEISNNSLRLIVTLTEADKVLRLRQD